MQPKGHFTVLVSIYVFQSVAGILMMSEPPPKVGFVGIIIIQSVNMLISGWWKATQEGDRDQRPKSHQEFCEECSHETGVLPVAGTQGHQFIRRNCVACALHATQWNFAKWFNFLKCYPRFGFNMVSYIVVPFAKAFGLSLGCKNSGCPRLCFDVITRLFPNQTQKVQFQVGRNHYTIVLQKVICYCRCMIILYLSFSYPFFRSFGLALGCKILSWFWIWVWIEVWIVFRL